MFNKTIYTKDSKGKIRFLTVQADGSNLIMISGINETPNPVTRVKSIKGKNIGKSNETTPEEQCIKECEAKIREKLASDYFETEQEAIHSEVILPMLANSYDDKTKKKLDFTKETYFIQPKLDGMRCLAIVNYGVVKLISRDNRDITGSVPHLVEQLEKINDREVILDGELYHHNLTFQEIMTRLKKYRGPETEEIEFHLYDVVSTDDYIQRYNSIQGIIKDYGLEQFKLITNLEVYSFSDISECFSRFVNLTYEGAMLRTNKGGYSINKRSNTLLKVKDFIDIQLPILDIVPSDADPMLGYPIYAWPGAKDDILKSGFRGTAEYKREALANKHKFICRMAEIRFFEYTDGGVPRFPVTVGIRLDK